jgi:curved DNA-binding protein CbpA
MTLTDYYKILDLPVNSSIEEIKKAYRKKARLYHPDVNQSPDAKDIFINITEAYEFLISNHNKIKSDDQAYNQAMEDWRKYRQYRARKRATVYSNTSFRKFRNTDFYKTTRIFDGTTIGLSFAISILVFVYAIYGYVYRLKNPVPGLDQPSVFTLILLLLPGIIFFLISFIYLKAYVENSKRPKKKA